MKILEEKIYQPHFISHSTIIAYQKLNDVSISLMKIIEDFYRSRQSTSKFYFKVLNKVIKNNKNINRERHFIDKRPPKPNTGYQKEGIIAPKTSDRKGGNGQITITLTNVETLNEQQLGLTQNVTLCENKSKITVESNYRSDSDIQMNSQFESEKKEETEYYEIELKVMENPADKNMLQSSDKSAEPSLQSSNKSRFVHLSDNNVLIIIVRNISQLIKYQAKLSNQKYMEAIEANYSHEQMNPLNCILGNSKIVYKRLHKMMKEYENHLNVIKPNEDKKNIKEINKETLMILNSINHQGQIMWFYNQNQIQRMKIKRGDFKNNKRDCHDLYSVLEKVIIPFTPQLLSRNIAIYISQFETCKVKADWPKYQLILFNIFQNAVKYNSFLGKIVINLKFINNPKQRDLIRKQSRILETSIIDCGTGIHDDKQKLLFEPFKELRKKDNIRQVENNSIGIGLTSSKEICTELDGKLLLKHSVKGLTVFQFQLPVIVDDDCDDDATIGLELQYQPINLEIFKNEVLMQQYMKDNGIESISQMLITGEYLNKSIRTLLGRQTVSQDKKQESVSNSLNLLKFGEKYYSSGRFPHRQQNQPSFANPSSYLNLQLKLQRSQLNLLEKNANKIENPKAIRRITSLKEQFYQNLIQNQQEESSSVSENFEQYQFNKGNEYVHHSAEREQIKENAQKIAKPENNPKALLNLNQELATEQKKQLAIQMLAFNFRDRQPSMSQKSYSDSHDSSVININLSRIIKKRQGRDEVALDSISMSSSYLFSSENVSNNDVQAEENKILNAQEEESFIDISQLGYNSNNISGCTPDSSSFEPPNVCDCEARILCVDDSEFNIIPVKHMIQENFHIQVDTANNGQEALQIFEKGYLKKCGCQNRTHTLILMDLQMPVMDGIQASIKIMDILKSNQWHNAFNKSAGDIQEEEKQPNQKQERDWQVQNQRKSDKDPRYQVKTKIVVVTAFTNQSTIDECEKIGIYEVVHKPLTFDKLQNVLKNHFYK